MEWKTGNSYAIVYLDAAGERSERTVDLIAIDLRPEGLVYLRCNCRLRGEERSFRADRILEARRIVPDQTGRKDIEIVCIRRLAEPEAEPTGPAETAGPRERTGWVLKTFLFCVGAVAGLSMLSPSLDWHDLAGELMGNAYQGGIKPSAEATLSAKLSSKPAPLPTSYDERIGGNTIRSYINGGLSSYTVLESGIRFNTKAAAVKHIRGNNLYAATGIADPALIHKYLAADLDGSGKLSFTELEAFQKATYRNFSYIDNDYALRPDLFLAAGGGDCEDFALYTAGLLRFWGWEPYIASFAPSSHGIGHAVCLSFEEGSIPAAYSYYTLSSWTTMDGAALKPGRYIAIDYDIVGGLTNAVGKSWKLRSVYRPEAIYGMEM
jgi:hypothetical protein